jgi:type I restriction enzyme S subunit
LNQAAMRQIPIPVAPPDQQKRIVAEIEKQFSRLDEAVANLKRVKANLKRYKAAVLKAAVEGRLVETEAELARREGRSYETGEQLLQRILETRCSQWQGKGKYKEPAAPDTTDLPELPEGWVWSTYEQLGRLQLGRQRAPKYHTGPNMRPYLRVQNVFEDRIDLSDVMEMDFPPSDFEKYQLAPGDLLLNEGQSPELLGRPAIYRGELPGACFTNTLIRFRAAEGVSVEFALHVSRHNMLAGRFVDEGTITTNIAHLSLGRLATVEFPLPPTAEQNRIVLEVERRLSLVRTVEAEVDANLKRADRLRQAVLARSFDTGSRAK